MMLLRVHDDRRCARLFGRKFIFKRINIANSMFKRAASLLEELFLTLRYSRCANFPAPLFFSRRARATLANVFLNDPISRRASFYYQSIFVIFESKIAPRV